MLPDLGDRSLQCHNVAEIPHDRAAVEALYVPGAVEGTLEMDDGECGETGSCGELIYRCGYKPDTTGDKADGGPKRPPSVVAAYHGIPVAAQNNLGQNLHLPKICSTFALANAENHLFGV